MTEEQSLDPNKVAKLEELISGTPTANATPEFNLDDYELDTRVPRHWYERAKWMGEEGKQTLVYYYTRTQIITNSWDKLQDEIEALENGQEAWRLVNIWPVAKRSGKTTGNSFAAALLRTVDQIALPLTPKNSDIAPPVETDPETLKKMADWEANNA